MIHFVAAVFIPASMGFGWGQPHPSLPAGHPTRPAELPGDHPDVSGRQNDPDIAVPPDANPADVESIDSIIGAYYDSLCGPKGEARDWDRLRSIFQPMARLVAARPVADGRSGIWVMELEEYIAFNKTYMENGGYFEREISRKTDTFGNIAQVWSTYESRRGEHDIAPYSRGIYSFQLLKDGDRWWIVNVYWDYERPDSPIPQEYLP